MARIGFARWMGALALVLAVTLAASASAPAAETPHNTVAFSCTSETFVFSGFPNLPGNKVNEIVSVDGKTVFEHKFVFDGPGAENTVQVAVPPGQHKLDARTTWNTNGVKGNQDRPDRGGIDCEAFPDLKIGKLQQFAGIGKFTAATLAEGHVGQTVNYELIVKNTGNVPLTLGEFADPHCDGGTITGGPGEAQLAPGATTTYVCRHVLSEADREVGSYINQATVTGTPPEGDGPPTTKTSNPVLVELPTPDNEASFSCEAVAFAFTGFPNVSGNRVTEIVHVDGKLVYKGTFVFDGPSGANSVPIALEPGHHKVDARTSWKTNTFKGSRDIPAKGGVVCQAGPN